MGEGFEPPNFNGGCPQILDQISKTTPIFDLLSYKGNLLVERPRTLGGDKKISVVKLNTSIHSMCGRRYNNEKETKNKTIIAQKKWCLCMVSEVTAR